MAINFLSVGTLSQGSATTATAPGRPAGLQAKDMMILLVATKSAVQPTITTPSGWTAPSNNSASGGTGTVTTADAGPVRVVLYYREALQALETMPAVVFDAAPSQFYAIVCLAFQKADNDSWSAPLCATASDTTGSTTLYDPAASATTLSLATGDMLVASDIINGDAGTPTLPGTMTVAGVTLGSLSTLMNVAITQGTDGRYLGAYGLYSSGTATAGPDRSVTYTSGGASMSGATVFYQLGTTADTQLPGPAVTSAPFRKVR